MSDDHINGLRTVMDGLRAEAGSIERVGRTLLQAELRRVRSLHAAAELVQRAIDTLADTAAAPAPEVRYRGDPSDAPPDLHERDGVQEFGLSGDDDTPGWRRRSRAPEQGRGDDGAGEF